MFFLLLFELRLVLHALVGPQLCHRYKYPTRGLSLLICCDSAGDGHAGKHGYNGFFLAVKRKGFIWNFDTPRAPRSRGVRLSGFHFVKCVGKRSAYGNTSYQSLSMYYKPSFGIEFLILYIYWGGGQHIPFII